MSITCDIFDPERVTETLVAHLKENDVYVEGRQAWTVAKSPLGGRGLLATRDIKRGELIVVDAPVLIGPRCLAKHLPMCVTCYKKECPLFPCDRGCGLPVCSAECENSTKHADRECKYLRSLVPTCGTDWCNELLFAVTPIRALSMTKQQRTCMATLQCHEILGHGVEIDLLCSKVANQVPEDDIKFLKHVCGVFNTNAFETVSVQDKDYSSSLRGLYPMGAMQNHCCVPNTRHHFDSECRLYVSASRDIPAGEELTMTYTSLFWDTTLRRQFLNATKNFWCECERCSDRTELGTNLGALFCASDKCSGMILPQDPLNTGSLWVCDKCKITLKPRQITSIRSGIAAAVEETQYQRPRQILRFMQRDLALLIPDSNYLMADMKFRIISYLGRTAGLNWPDLTDDELAIKKVFCTDLLSVLDALNCGDCKKKGLLLYELYCTNTEIARRSQKVQNGHSGDSPGSSEMVCGNDKLLEEARNILQNDVLAITMQKADGLY